MKKLPEQYFIYETSYGTDIPVCQLFLHTFDEVPSIYKQHDKIYKSQVRPDSPILSENIHYIPYKLKWESNMTYNFP